MQCESWLSYSKKWQSSPDSNDLSIWQPNLSNQISLHKLFVTYLETNKLEPKMYYFVSLVQNWSHKLCWTRPSRTLHFFENKLGELDCPLLPLMKTTEESPALGLGGYSLFKHAHVKLFLTISKYLVCFSLSPFPCLSSCPLLCL